MAYTFAGANKVKNESGKISCCLSMFILLLHFFGQTIVCLFASYIYWSKLLAKIGNRQGTPLSLHVCSAPTFIGAS